VHLAGGLFVARLKHSAGRHRFNRRLTSFASRGGHLYDRLSALGKNTPKNWGRIMAEQLGRFGMAITVLALCAACLYQVSGFASYAKPGTPGVVFRYGN